MAVFLDLDETLVHSICMSRLGWSKTNPYPAKIFTVEKAGTSLSVFLGKSAMVNESRKRLAVRLSNFTRTVLSDHIMCWRPGLKQFLKELSSTGYAINVWTAASRLYADEVVRALGMYRYGLKLTLAAEDYPRGMTKSLRYLQDKRIVNRPLREMVIVDDREEVKRVQPLRAVQIRPFKAAVSITPCAEKRELDRVRGAISLALKM
ncbi:putative NIF/NLI interacting factor [Largemouth bass virus]|uniref:NIF/NLI interacting factor n=1 Tax=Largemouth bass virus TaxID=176656 RepID=A0A9E7PQB0_9VIRU|nr:putative NIF/NLI interacting factor [Mandarin fish ranavirus]UUY86268.1 putative NIF/NLI interacting factor [Largemouth bass virus]WEI29017.1 putative NIF/NLI interacting factor [Largemouth bass virus]WHA35584.1 putative NIF/NLI interacting factor [Micropterus salmoides ranavirus]WHA35689.1 putative NIF/NLI interacting factor [Siniperca chuatsi ranavirus]